MVWCAAAEDLWHTGPLQDIACLIVDVRLPRMSGLKRQRQVAATHGPLPRIVITGRVPRGLRIIFRDCSQAL